MKDSRLVQRLDPPASNAFGLKDNPFAFGGGMKNGGLSDEAMDLLRGIFSFDYMGAAEFEFGAVPEALSRIAKSKNLTPWVFNIQLKKVAKGWRDKSKKPPEGAATIYVLSNKDNVDEIQDRIEAWAGGKSPKGDHGYEMHLKENTNIASVLRPCGDYTPQTAGWLELDNGFFFFVDKEMWEKTAQLFGLET